VRLGLKLRAIADTSPFLWASHPMLAVDKDWRISIDADGVQADAEMPGRFQPGQALAPAELERALVVPDSDAGWAEVLYVTGTAEAAVLSPDGRFGTRIAWDSSFLRHLWIVTVTGLLDLDLCLLFEPCTTRPYRLEEAIETSAAPSLVSGETREWWVELESLDAA
jgi:hypothetical protein